jgi:hypothetical protein
MQHILSLLESWHVPLGAAASNTASIDLGAVLLVFFFCFLIFCAVLVLIVASVWKLFKKAGRPGWAAIIPFYSSVVELELTSLPLWWIVLLFVPFVNLVFFVIVLHRLAVVFGRGWGFTLGMIFLPFIFFPILAFGKASYKNTYPPAKPMSETTKWALIGAGAFLLLESFVFHSRQTSPSYTDTYQTDSSALPSADNAATTTQAQW